MTRETLARLLETRVPADVRALHRPERAAFVRPLLEALVGDLHGKSIVEVGSGETLLLAKALVEAGAAVTAIDPVLSDPRVEPRPVRCIAADALSIEPSAIVPADATLSTLLFGAPLRQRARRELWPRYRAGDRPDEAEVAARQASIEIELISRLSRWTRPGGVTVHFSLEGLFTATADDWRRHGFEPIGWPTAGASDLLGRTLLARAVR